MAGATLHQTTHVAFLPRHLEPSKAEQTAPKAAEARRWLLGAEANGRSESKDSSSGVGCDTGRGG